MKLDLLYEIQVPKPWEPNQADAEYKAYWQVAEQIELADRVGFDTAWFVEHHFREERSHCGAPEVFLGAMAQRTKSIKMGHGVVLLPYPFNHPIRVAERAAVLDIMSNGRFEFGTGKSTQFEQEGFRINPDETTAMWREALEMIPKMWTQETFQHKGKYFDIPERNIMPKPHQKPHPRIWMACTHDESFVTAGELGIGVLGLTLLVNHETVANRIKAYHDALKHATPVGKFINNQFSAYTMVHCAETQEKAKENGAYGGIVWYIDGQISNRQKWEGSTSLFGQYKKYPVLQAYADGKIGVEYFDNEDMVIIGDPDKVIRKMEKYEQMGLDHLMCNVEFGPLSHESVKRSIELLGKHVIPHFKSRARVAV